ncbi:MAG: 3-dehydroquinate synthase [Candidatus Omnitrophota bacterium]|nr:3-dehydroquinate synthase [Candidatus Omnitrophota bacterium]
MKTIRIRLKERSYDIVIGAGLLSKAGVLLRRLRLGRDAVVITNKALLGLYKRDLETSLHKGGFTVRFELVPDSEKAKSSEIALKLISGIAAYDKKRSVFIIAFGGGVIGDLAGFVAAIYKRGVPYVQIPTTLLAQVDSAIGGKTAIDLKIAKNLVGAFYQPRMVISDISLLETLPARQIRNGLAEVIKYGVIKDERLFNYLEKKYSDILRRDKAVLEFVVSRSSLIKARVVEADELDKTGLRAILNYGHTVGHAIESASSYSSRYNHGESVAIGMAVACDISLKLKLIGSKACERIKRLIEKAGLPTKITGLNFSKIRESLAHDKKFAGGKNRLVLPVSIGKVSLVDGVPYNIISEAIKNRSL